MPLMVPLMVQDGHFNNSTIYNVILLLEDFKYQLPLWSSYIIIRSRTLIFTP